MNVKRITRLLKLIQTLQSGVERNAAALAKSCGVTRRTIFRDLEALRQTGVPLEFNREVERYSIRRQFFLPPTDLTPEEVFLLLILASDFGQNLDRCLGNDWHLIPSERPGSHVYVCFRPLVAGNVSEVIWHKTQRTRLPPDGSLEFRAAVSGLNEVACWILSSGNQSEVIQPARLRRLIAPRAQNMARMYNGSN